MDTPQPHGVTQLLLAWRQGDQAALEQLLPLVYGELQQMARQYLRQERDGHTLQTTALVHEAYLRLINIHAVAWQDRAHFFCVAARTMRRVLVDYARARNYQKRGGGAQQASFAEAEALLGQERQRLEDVLVVNEVLEQLTVIDARAGEVFEMKFFGGLTVNEIAEVVGVSDRTIKKDLQFAKLWLKRAWSQSA
ncbi:MAG: sigma-70 family RNA polymerase sigma factor [Blastocatellia bacterium]